MDLQSVLGGANFSWGLEVDLPKDKTFISTIFTCRCSYGEQYQREGGKLNYQSGFYYCNFFFCCNKCKDNLEVVKLCLLNSSWKIFWNQELREQTKVFERLVREVCKGDDPFQDFMDQLNSIPFDWVSTDQVAKMRLKSSSPRSTERTAVSSLDESPTKVSWKTELCFKLLQPLGRRSMCVFSLITGESATSAE